MRFGTTKHTKHTKAAERRSLPRRSFRLSSEARRRMEAKADPNRRVRCRFTPNRSSALLSGETENESLPAVQGIVTEGHFAGIVTFVPDRKSTRLNSSHLGISYAVFC